MPLRSQPDCIEYSSSPADLQANAPIKRSNNVPASRSKNVLAGMRKSARSRVRRTPLKDRQAVERIRSFANALDRGMPAIGDATSHPLSVANPPSPNPCLKQPKSTSNPSNDNLVDWEKTGSLTKLSAATWSLLTEERQAIAFSFDLITKSEGAARSDAGGPVDWLKRHLDKQFTKRFGKGSIPYFFSLDISKAGRLHVHGAFLPMRDTEYHRDQVREAMKAAWGVWRLDCGRENPKQTDFRPLYSCGWITYQMETHRKVARIIGDDRVFTMTQDLRREAQQTYNEIRRLMADPELAWWRSLPPK